MQFPGTPEQAYALIKDYEMPAGTLKFIYKSALGQVMFAHIHLIMCYVRVVGKHGVTVGYMMNTGGWLPGCDLKKMR